MMIVCCCNKENLLNKLTLLGFLCGLNEADMTCSLATLNAMAMQLGATTQILKRKILDSGKTCVEVLVRKLSDTRNIEEVRISVMGSADAGKSSLIGVLTTGELDNGRGKARLNMFRHVHEIKTGRTSCVSHELLGFDVDGGIINYKHNEMMTTEEISERSNKLISLMDLGGHRRYMRTTIQAVSGYSPHFIALVIACGHLNSATIENLQIIKAFRIPFFVILTKTDLVNPDATIEELHRVLKDKQKNAMMIGSMKDLREMEQTNDSDSIPVFCISNVNGTGLDLVKKYLFLLTPSVNEIELQRLAKESPEFHIDEIFRVAGVGTIVGGLLVKGVMNEKMKVKCGPGPMGEFYKATVKSIHRNKFPCKGIRPNQSASVCFSFNKELPILRSGMVLIADDDDEQNEAACLYFQVS